jgi:hypothetical protein
MTAFHVTCELGPALLEKPAASRGNALEFYRRNPNRIALARGAVRIGSPHKAPELPAQPTTSPGLFICQKGWREHAAVAFKCSMHAAHLIKAGRREF